MVEFRIAKVSDAAILTETRRKAWDATYRGIYPDDMIDNYDSVWYSERDRQRISDPEQKVYLLMDGDSCCGYLCVGSPAYGRYKDFALCLNALYILPAYQGQGCGRQAFRLVAEECRRRGLEKFFCGCNAHNRKARNFYGHMGGHLGAAKLGHQNHAMDQVYFEFILSPEL
ncbi:MAG: GNAT family N-acetyltransferase [Oscillospiraceae bacterium]|nr:GNAT family N-acetyltransferase [Oscillospiraceae bacterium]